ncbi:hypothetical protein [Aureimonas ureilytica]|uniref:hypothetical protein n=1 Tax=Aureimonas ureilytica TaxID=401562 RepID=UPI00037117A6|nr:hypothetical protein [Aureimonas ureilytica]
MRYILEPAASKLRWSNVGRRDRDEGNRSMARDPSDDSWLHRGQQSDRAAILAALAMLLGTISLAFTLADA